MSFIELSATIALSIIGLSILLIFLRLLIVALDLLSANTIAFIAVYSILNAKTSFLDVGIILALLVFLGTVAFAWYLDRRRKS